MRYYSRTIGLLIALFTSLGFTQSVAADTTEPDAEQTSEPCVYARNVRNIDVIDEQLLVLRGTADRYWISRLPNKCDGLTDRMYLAIDRYGSKICRNDRFEAHENGGGFYTSCRFGEFEPVAKGTVDTLKMAAVES